MGSAKRILVTGGLGLIGHNVVRRLQSAGHDTVTVDICTTYGIVPKSQIDYLVSERRKRLDPLTKIYAVDISDQVGMQCVFRNFRPHTVIHLASFPRQKVVNADPRAGSRTMSEGLLNLLELSAEHGVERFVYVSSSMVYGNFADDVREDAECTPLGQYGIMKLAGEWMVRDYARRGFYDHVIVRPSAVYGELDVEDRVISQFMLAALRGTVLKVNGESEHLDFTYVEDAADGIVSAAMLPVARNKIYNITRGRSRSLMEAANLVVQIAGRGIIHTQDRDRDFPSRGALNIEAARRDLGFSPKIDIEEGFQRYHDWLKDSLYWSKKTI